jgi:ABC-type amino acid transport substrate-binding protein
MELTDMKKNAILLLILLIFLLNGCQSSLDTNLPREGESSSNDVNDQVLTIAIIDDTSPYSDFVDGEYKGLIIDIIREAFNRMDVAFEFSNLPFNRSMTLLQEGTLDIGTDIFINPEREKYLLFPIDAPLSIYPYALFKRKDKEIDYDGDASSLTPYTISYVRGYYLGSFDQYLDNPEYSIIASDSPEVNMKQLYNERVDLSIEVLSTGLSLIKEFGYENDIEPLPISLGENTSYIAFSKSRGLESLMHSYQETILAMYKDGTLATMYETYDLEIPAAYGK